MRLIKGYTSWPYVFNMAPGSSCLLLHRIPVSDTHCQSEPLFFFPPSFGADWYLVSVIVNPFGCMLLFSLEPVPDTPITICLGLEIPELSGQTQREYQQMPIYSKLNLAADLPAPNPSSGHSLSIRSVVFFCRLRSCQHGRGSIWPCVIFIA